MPSARDLVQTIRLRVNSRNATKGLKQASSATDQWKKGLAALAVVTGVVTVAFVALNKRLDESIAKYREQARGLLQLKGRFGENTAAVIAQGQALKDLTGASIIQITHAQQLAGAMGATSETVEELALASLNLAAAFGTDLDQAARQISVTLGGYGGELGERIPELKEFTAEQLKAGAAATLINQKLKDAAKEGLTEFERGLRAVANAEEAAAIAIGKAATSTDDFRAVQEIGVAVAEAYSKEVENGSAFMNLWAAVTQRAKNGFDIISFVLTKLANKVLPEFTDEVGKATAAEKENAKFTIEMARGHERLNRILANESKQLKEVSGIFSDLGTVLDSEVNAAIEENERRLLVLRQAYDDNNLSLASYNRGVAALMDDTAELTASMSDQAGVINDVSDPALQRLAEKLGVVRVEAEGAAAGIREATEAAAGLDRGGIDLGFNISGGVFTIPVREPLRGDRGTPGDLAAGPAQGADVSLAGNLSEAVV